jgi:hypothetical protein
MKELEDFTGRCIRDIEEGPESMTAGLSNNLLKQIVSKSALTMHIIFTKVFVKFIQRL